MYGQLINANDLLHLSLFARFRGDLYRFYQNIAQAHLSTARTRLNRYLKTNKQKQKLTVGLFAQQSCMQCLYIFRYDFVKRKIKNLSSSDDKHMFLYKSVNFIYWNILDVKCKMRNLKVIIRRYISIEKMRKTRKFNR